MAKTIAAAATTGEQQKRLTFTVILRDAEQQGRWERESSTGPLLAIVQRGHRTSKKVLLFETFRKPLLFWIDLDRFSFPACSNEHQLRDPSDIQQLQPIGEDSRFVFLLKFTGNELHEETVKPLSRRDPAR